MRFIRHMVTIVSTAFAVGSLMLLGAARAEASQLGCVMNAAGPYCYTLCFWSESEQAYHCYNYYQQLHT